VDDGAPLANHKHSSFIVCCVSNGDKKILNVYERMNPMTIANDFVAHLTNIGVTIEHLVSIA
jgi:hypothetical protein